MTMLIKSEISRSPPNTRSLVIMSDVDELPARHTVDLLKRCDYGSVIHLQLRNYIYRWSINF